MNTHEILIAAKALIDTPEKWIKGRYAANVAGKTIGPREDTASCFCSVGALYHLCADSFDLHQAQGKLEGVIPFGRDWGLIAFNDASTHAEVMSAFDRAIEETGK